MGRVLPSLETRTGITSVADALGATKDQQLQNALRRAARTKAEERKTPEGMMKFIGNLAQTAGQVAGTADKIGSLVGKIPVTQAMREAAAARATRETGGADKIVASIREQFGDGPVTKETVDIIMQMTQSSDPNQRVAAHQLLPEIRKRAADQAAKESRFDLEQRAGALGYTPESLQEALTAGDLEAKALPLTRERAVIERADDPNQQVDPNELAAARSLVAAEEERLAADEERMQGARSLALDAQQEPAPTEIQESLSEVTDLSPEDRMTVAVEQFSRTLSPDPQTAQSQLLASARSATTPQQQELVLKAAETISILPQGTLLGISPFVDPREQFIKQLTKQFPTSAQLGQMARATIASEDRQLGIQQRRDAAAVTADIKREAEEGRQVRFEVKRGDQNRQWKQNQNRLSAQFERTQKRLDDGLELQKKRLALALQKLKDNKQYRKSRLELRKAGNRLRGLSIAERRKGRGQAQKVVLTGNIGVINSNLKEQIKARRRALAQANAAYDKAESVVLKLGKVNPALTKSARNQQERNFNIASEQLKRRLDRSGGINDQTKALKDLEAKQGKIDALLAKIVGPGGGLDVSDEDLLELQAIAGGDE